MTWPIRSQRGNKPHRRTGLGRRLSPIVVFVCAFIFAAAGSAYAFWTTSTTNGSGQDQAVTLNTPGAGSATSPTTTSLLISWGASSGLPSHAGYIVLRSTSSGGPFTAISNGSCNQSSTGGSSATSCTDNDTSLTPGTTYFYKVEAAYVPGPLELWFSPTDSVFSGATSSAPSITSASSTTFTAGTAGNFTVTTSAVPTVNSITDANFGSCVSSSLPTGVALNYTSGSTATIVSTTASPAGTYTLCLNASNGVSPNATQQFSLTIAGTATKLVYATGSAPPSSTTAGTTFSVVVNEEDGFGNIETGDSSTALTLSANNGGGGFSCTTSPTKFTAGVASYSGCSYTVANATAYTLTAASSGLTSATANTTVSAGAFSKYGVSLATNPTAGSSKSVTLIAQDSFGNTEATYNASNQTITWSGPTSSPNSTASTLPSGTVSFSSGQSTTALSVTFTHAGSQTLKATDGSSRTGQTTVTVNSAGATLSFSIACPAAGFTSWSPAVNVGTDSFGNPASYATPGVTFTVALAGSQPSHWSLNGTAGPTSVGITATSSPTNTFTVTHLDNGSGKTATVTVSGPTGGGFTSASCNISS